MTTVSETQTQPCINLVVRSMCYAKKVHFGGVDQIVLRANVTSGGEAGDVGSDCRRC